MTEEENIAAYLLYIDEIINIVGGLGETINEKFIVQKVLSSLPMRFNPKISTLEDGKELEKLTIDELHGIITACEIIIGKEEVPKIEAASKASRKTNKRNERSSDSSNHESDVEEARFVRRLQRGTGKYKVIFLLNVLIVVK